MAICETNDLLKDKVVDYDVFWNAFRGEKHTVKIIWQIKKREKKTKLVT